MNPPAPVTTTSSSLFSGTTASSTQNVCDRIDRPMFLVGFSWVDESDLRAGH
jgi:hypothetical protein